MPKSTIDIEDSDSLAAYLRSSGRIGDGEEIVTRILAGGVSNKTVLVRRPTGESWVVKQALPKLRTKADWFSDPARIRREALALEWLPRLAPPHTITPLVFRDDDANLLAMEAVPEPHENWKTLLLAGRVDPDHIQQFADLLASIHVASHREPEVAELFDDCSYFESLRLEPYYGYAAQNVPEAAGFLHALVDDTRSLRWCLTHGDYSPKNVLVRFDAFFATPSPPGTPGGEGWGEGGRGASPKRESSAGSAPLIPVLSPPGVPGGEGGQSGRLILLDHEVAHWGDGTFDVGFALTHLLSKAHHVANHRTSFAHAARQFWSRYLGGVAEIPHRLESRAVRHTLGCLLARVAGRSPLEYLSEDERSRQRAAAVALMRETPATIDVLIDRFLHEIERCP